MYYPDDEGRQEYVLSDVGAIYMGSKETLLSRDWVFGQVRFPHELDRLPGRQITSATSFHSLIAASWTRAFTSWTHPACPSETAATPLKWSGKVPPW